VLKSAKQSNAMAKSTIPVGVGLAAIVEEAWQEVGAGFERLCLTAGIAPLAGMMEGDAARLCGACYGRDVRVPVERDHGFRWNVITDSGGT
jgi:hypothetical protein